MGSKDEEIEEEAILNQDKSELEQTASAGIHGGFELKKSEKRRFLGEFKERVIKALTFNQISEPGVYPEILAAIRDSEAEKLIINRQVDVKAAKEYIDLARQNGLSFKKVESDEFKGDIGLVVVSDEAVNSEEIRVPNKEQKFKELNLPVELIDEAGKKICAECYTEIADKAPEELVNFKKMDWFDKLFQPPCFCQK